MAEPEQKSEQNKKIPFFHSLQGKYAVSYMIVIAVVLVLLNTYPLLASQNLLVSSKQNAMKSQAAVMASALMELETLSSEQVVRVMNMLDNMGLSRILVTDPAGMVLYDSKVDAERDKIRRKTEPEESEGYRYALYQEIVSALKGNDVAYSRYEDREFISTAACPIVYRGMIIGSVYVMEVDPEQGQLLANLQENLRNISLIIGVVTLVVCALFSKVLTARVGALLRAIRVVGEGEYGHRLQPVGRDEMAQLADEFNHLTDRLQATEEVRRRFVSDASHELKTPLASIRLLADSIMQTDEMDEEMVREFVGDIGAEANRLTRITEHLLSLTRLDSLPVGDTVPVDVSWVIARAVNMLGPVADREDVKIESSLKEDCIIRCTEDDLYQICFNLVENAIKYNFPGGTVSVSVHTEDDQVLLEVKDTGVGIPEEDIPKIFNRFYRVDKARSRAAGGTGLGLSIVRDTVRRHGGWVTARRRNSGGTSFMVGFPRVSPEDEEEQA